MLTPQQIQEISFEKVRSLFAFGWKLLCASLLDTVFNNLYGLLIGKIYNEELLGSYNRGEQFPKLIATNLGAAIQAVLLPAFSAKQDDMKEVRSMVRMAIQLSSFVVLPMLLGLFAVADTLVLVLLGVVCLGFGLHMEPIFKWGPWMDIVSIYIIPIGATLGAISWFWVMKREDLLHEINKGTAKSHGKLWHSMGRYAYVLCAAILCAVALFMKIAF